MVREHVLTADAVIWPLFLIDGENKRVPASTMPGVEQVSVDEAVRDAERAAKLRIPRIALFPYTDPKLRDETKRSDLAKTLQPICIKCRDPIGNLILEVMGCGPSWINPRRRIT